LPLTSSVRATKRPGACRKMTDQAPLSCSWLVPVALVGSSCYLFIIIWRCVVWVCKAQVLDVHMREGRCLRSWSGDCQALRWSAESHSISELLWWGEASDKHSSGFRSQFVTLCVQCTVAIGGASLGP
jgi:hypothetical protein